MLLSKCLGRKRPIVNFFKTFFLIAAATLTSACGHSSGGNNNGGNYGTSQTGARLDYDLNARPSWFLTPISAVPLGNPRGKGTSIGICWYVNLKLEGYELSQRVSSYNGFRVTEDIVFSGNVKVTVGKQLGAPGTYRNSMGSYATDFSVRLKAGSSLQFLTYSNERSYPKGMRFEARINLTGETELSELEFETTMQGNVRGAIEWANVSDVSKNVQWVDDNAAKASSSSSSAPSNQKRLTDCVALRDFVCQEANNTGDRYSYQEVYEVDGFDFNFLLEFFPDGEEFSLGASWNGWLTPEAYVMLIRFNWLLSDTTRRALTINFGGYTEYGFGLTVFEVVDYILKTFPEADNNSGRVGTIYQNDLNMSNLQQYIHDGIEILRESFRRLAVLLERLDPGTTLW